eukprot:439479_1
MALDFSRVKYIDTKTKTIVHGYLRKSHKIIPDIVIHICLLFYDRDMWDPQHIGCEMEIDTKDSNIISYKLNAFSGLCGYNTAFLSRICDPLSKSIYHWKFKIIMLSNVWNLIGIWKITNNSPPKDTYFTKGFYTGYAINITRGRLVVLTSGGKSSGDYCCQCKSADVVEMFLDCTKDVELKYTINGKDYGVAFKIDTRHKYRAAVCLQSPIGSIQLMH